MATNNDKEFLWRSEENERASGDERLSSGDRIATESGGTFTADRAKELAQWWWSWWFERYGYSGAVLPATLAVLYWLLLGWPAFLLGAGLGIFARMLWARGSKRAKVGSAAVAGLPLAPVALVLALWLAPLAAMIALVWLLVNKVSSRGPQPTGHYHARWAESAETEDMRMSVYGGDREGILLAQHGGELIGVYPGFENKREMGHALIASPTRGGKGLHLLANLLRWRGSIVVNDIKGELHGTSARWRAERLGSEIMVLDPTGRGSRYDPFAELSYNTDALRSAAELIMAPEEEKQPIFARRAVNGLCAAALAARKEGTPTIPYTRELTREGPKAFAQRLAETEDEHVREYLIDFIGAPPEELPDEHFHDNQFFASAWETLITKIRPFYSEGVLKMCSGHDFYASDLVESPKTLYLMFAESELRHTKKVYQVVLQALITGLIRHGDTNPASSDEVPLLLALDEAGRTPIPDLDDMVSTVAGRGMSVMIYVQDLSQLDSAYDEDRAKIIRGNCHTQLFYRPADPDTAKYISRMSGQTSAEDVNISRSRDPMALRHPPNESRTMSERELITEDEARQISQETVFIFVGEKPPIFAQRLKWFELMPEAAQFAKENPPDEPPELSMPDLAFGEIRTGGKNGHGENNQTPSENSNEPADEDAREEESENGGRRRRRRSGQGGSGAGGYIEPDV